MRVAIISDERLPTAWDYPGHGLGKHCLSFADGLAEQGHKITLYGAPKSVFQKGRLVQYESTSELRTEFTNAEFDVIIDSSHKHEVWKYTGIPVACYSPDREHPPGPNAVFPSAAHRAFHHANGYVLPNYVDTDLYAYNDTPDDYFLFMASTVPQKGLRTALYTAHTQNVPLILTGTNTEHLCDGLGVVQGALKIELLQNAKALLFPSPHEAGPFTVLEAMSCGTPVICYNKGGAADYVIDDLTGYCAEDQESFAELVHCIDDLNRWHCREHVLSNHSKETTISLLESILERLIDGETW